MKLKMRLIENGKTIDFKVVHVKTLKEIGFLIGFGVDDEARQKLIAKGKNVIFDSKSKRELHMVLTND